MGKKNAAPDWAAVRLCIWAQLALIQSIPDLRLLVQIHDSHLTKMSYYTRNVSNTRGWAGSTRPALPGLSVFVRQLDTALGLLVLLIGHDADHEFSRRFRIVRGGQDAKRCQFGAGAGDGPSHRLEG